MPVVSQEDVARFDVSMDFTAQMQVLQSFERVLQDHGYLVLVQLQRSMNARVIRPSRSLTVFARSFMMSDTDPDPQYSMTI